MCFLCTMKSQGHVLENFNIKANFVFIRICFIFNLVFECLSVWVFVYVSAVLIEARRGHCFPWIWCFRPLVLSISKWVLSSYRTHVLCKNTEYSYPLSYLSCPDTQYFYIHKITRDLKPKGVCIHTCMRAHTYVCIYVCIYIHLDYI